MAHTADLELSAEELRVLGELIEKERATPEGYPLTTNALRTACNQKSSRDPVVDYTVGEVETAMLSLRDKGYARTVTGSGRTVKHKQVIDEALGLTNAEVSLLGVLMLRGPQTPNELRTRTDRLHGFDDNESVEGTLETMAIGEPPLVRCIGRASGQREDRWVHLLAADGGPVADTSVHGAAPEPMTVRPTSTPSVETTPMRELQVDPSPTHPASPMAAASGLTSSDTGSADDQARITELEAEVADLRNEVDHLRDRFDDLANQLGISPS